MDCRGRSRLLAEPWDAWGNLETHGSFRGRTLLRKGPGASSHGWYSAPVVHVGDPGSPASPGISSLWESITASSARLWRRLHGDVNKREPARKATRQKTLPTISNSYVNRNRYSRIVISEPRMDVNATIKCNRRSEYVMVCISRQASEAEWVFALRRGGVSQSRCREPHSLPQCKGTPFCLVPCPPLRLPHGTRGPSLGSFSALLPGTSLSASKR